MLAGLTLLTIGYVGTAGQPVRRRTSATCSTARSPRCATCTSSSRCCGCRSCSAWRTRAEPRVRACGGCAYRPRRWSRPCCSSASAPAWLLLLRPGPGLVGDPGVLAAGDRAGSPRRTRPARTLVVPGSGFAQHTWGRTVDEPIQPLAGAPWATRAPDPARLRGQHPGHGHGRGGARPGPRLARAGRLPRPLRLPVPAGAPRRRPRGDRRAADRRDPAGGRAVAGPGAGGDVRAAGRRRLRRAARSTTAIAVPAIEIFEVRRGRCRSRPRRRSADVPVVSGGPESLLGRARTGAASSGADGAGRRRRGRGAPGGRRGSSPTGCAAAS